MPFKSVNDILDVAEIRRKCQENPFLHLFMCWEETVGTAIANHTQPLSIQRNILWVATSSSAWSQNLTFKRRHLLNKLNKLLIDDLTDIKFSTSGWKSKKNSHQDTNKLSLSQHPSYIDFPKQDSLKNNLSLNPSLGNILPNKPRIIFAEWEKTINPQSKNYC